MALVYKDPSLVDLQMDDILREVHGELKKLRAKSGCSPDGHLGDNCLFLIDSCSFSNVYAWSQPAFRDIRTIPGPYAREDLPVKATHHIFPLNLRPGDWGLPLAGLISRFPDFLTAKLSAPFREDYDACIYSFSLLPWVRERVYSAAALNCHGKGMSKAHLLRHIAVNMIYALHEKRPDMTKLQVFQALINVHFRQLVVLGHARGDKIIFAEVRWVDATAPL